MDLGLEGKIAVVTGTAYERGNGRAIALELAREGVDVACADINIEGAESISREIRDIGRKSVAVKVDQSDYNQVKEAVGKISEELGSIDILVNNAAMLGPGGLINKMDLDAWHNMIQVDLSGPYYWIREVFDSMAQKRWGRIINISSIAGMLGGFGQANYSSSKGGLVSLTKTVALEGARFGITANAVTLGVIATDALKYMKEDMRERIKNRVALRTFGEPSDVANIVTFLASDRASYITGADITVTGGLDLFTF